MHTPRNSLRSSARWLPALALGLTTAAATPAALAQSPGDDDDDDETVGQELDEVEEEFEEEFDSNPYVSLSPGLVMVPFETGNVGYQWGLGGGYLLRTDGLFAIGLGGNFEHGIYELGDVAPALKPEDHQFRVQFEATPGVMLVDERLFLHATLGLGYAALLQRWTPPGADVASAAYHGIAVSPGLGVKYRVWCGLFVGAEVGVDLQWLGFDATPFDAHNFDAKVSVGWLF